MFGAPGAPAARVAEAVQASCSVPWIFAPVTIGGREYVDGGVWSNTNLDIAPAMRSTQVLCLNPIASLDIALASPFGMLRAIAGSTAAIETLAVRSRGAKVRMIGPSTRSAASWARTSWTRGAATRCWPAATPRVCGSAAAGRTSAPTAGA